MSKSYSKYADMRPAELHAEETVFHIEQSIAQADSPIALRQAYDIRPVRSLPAACRPEQVHRVAESIRGKLYQLGLDMDNTDDERIAGLQNGFAAVYDPDFAKDTDRIHPSDAAETTLLSAYYRTLSAVDVGSDTHMRLVPQSELVQKNLYYDIAATALQFTAGEEYERPHRYPRKAWRQVTDPASPYWHCAIGTDTWPGTFDHYLDGPNVDVSVPTGLITDASLLAQRANKYLTNDTWKQSLEAGYVPGTLHAQHLNQGKAMWSEEQVDTRSGYVSQFLQATKTM